MDYTQDCYRTNLSRVLLFTLFSATSGVVISSPLSNENFLYSDNNEYEKTLREDADLALDLGATAIRGNNYPIGEISNGQFGSGEHVISLSNYMGTESSTFKNLAISLNVTDIKEKLDCNDAVSSLRQRAPQLRINSATCLGDNYSMEKSVANKNLEPQSCWVENSMYVCSRVEVIFTPQNSIFDDQTGSYSVSYRANVTTTEKERKNEPDKASGFVPVQVAGVTTFIPAIVNKWDPFETRYVLNNQYDSIMLNSNNTLRNVAIGCSLAKISKDLIVSSNTLTTVAGQYILNDSVGNVADHFSVSAFCADEGVSLYLNDVIGSELSGNITALTTYNDVVAVLSEYSTTVSNALTKSASEFDNFCTASNIYNTGFDGIINLMGTLSGEESGIKKYVKLYSYIYKDITGEDLEYEDLFYPDDTSSNYPGVFKPAVTSMSTPDWMNGTFIYNGERKAGLESYFRGNANRIAIIASLYSNISQPQDPGVNPFYLLAEDARSSLQNDLGKALAVISAYNEYNASPEVYGDIQNRYQEASDILNNSAICN